MPAPVDAPRVPPRMPAHPLDSSRELLERAFRLPSAQRPGGLPSFPSLLRGLGRAAAGLGRAAAAAGTLARFLTSDAELNLAKLAGKVPASVSGRDWQMAGAAFERWNAGWRVPSTWTPAQVGRGIEGAAALQDRLAAGRISPRRFDEEMSRLVRRIGGDPKPTGIRSAAPPSRPAAPPPSRPADRAGVGDPAALRRGLPARESRVTHTRGPGATAGAAAGELNRQALDRQARALENARRIVHERSRTLLPGGPSIAQIAREVYRERRPELQAAGLGENAFVALVRAPGHIGGPHGSGRVTASTGSGPGGTARIGPSGDGGEADRARAVGARPMTLEQMRESYPRSVGLMTHPARRERLEALEREGWRIAVEPQRAGETVATGVYAIPGSKVLLLPETATQSLGSQLVGESLDRALGSARSLSRPFDGPPVAPRLQPASILPKMRERDGAQGVRQFSPAEAQAHRLRIGGDGRLFATDGRTAIDSSGATSRLGGRGRMNVVLDMQGRLFGGPSADRVFHSSYVAGADVAFAGEIEVVDGRLRTITDGSGHYEPKLAHTIQFLQWLRHQGVDLTQVRVVLYTDIEQMTGPSLF